MRARGNGSVGRMEAFRGRDDAGKTILDALPQAKLLKKPLRG